jgi:hypothetical protein
MINVEESYLAVQNAVKAIKANEPKPENIPQDFWEVLKKFHDKKSS